MKRFTIPVFLLVMLVLPMFSGASGVQFAVITSEIRDGGTTDNTVKLTFALPAPRALEYPILGDVKDFSWDADFDGRCSISKEEVSLVRCDLVGVNRTSRTLNLNYTASGFVKTMEKDKWLYTHIYQSSLPVDNLIFTLKFQEGTGLVESSPDGSGLSPFTPKDGETRTDGRRLMIEWVRYNVSTADTLSISAVYENINKTQESGVLVVGLIISVVLVALFVFLYLKKPKEVLLKDDSLDSVLPVLRNDERAVIDCILKENGQINQRKIVYDTNFSKAKVSRLIKDLKDRNIIRVEEVGRINKIYLLKKPKEQPGTIKPPENKPEDQSGSDQSGA